MLIFLDFFFINWYFFFLYYWEFFLFIGVWFKLPLFGLFMAFKFNIFFKIIIRVALPNFNI